MTTDDKLDIILRKIEDLSDLVEMLSMDPQSVHRSRVRALAKYTEHYGKEIQGRDCALMIGAIQTEKAVFVKRLGSYRTVWDIAFRDETVRAVYHKKSKSIVDILPRADRETRDGTEESA